MSPIAHSRLGPGSFTLDELAIAAPAGSVDDAFRQCYKALGMDYPKFHKMDPAAKLAVLVAEPVLRVARERGADLSGGTAMLVLSRSGSSASDMEHWQVRQSTGLAGPAIFVYTLPNIGAGEITIRHGMHGPSLCLMTDAPDDPAGPQAAAMLLRDPGVRWLVCVWADIFADRFDAQAALHDRGPANQAHPTTLFPSTTGPWTPKP